MEDLLIRSAQGDYAVQFVDRLDQAVAALSAQLPAAIVIDRRVAELHGPALAPLLERVPTLRLEATEANKTLAGVEACLSFCQAHGLHRRSRLLAIGGGIIQDIVAFSAHAYYRGIDWTFLPSTLLAMSDSCIGAKCGLNLGAFKNQLGVFHAPRQVVICPALLDTLDPADVASGYGEILKLMLTGSREHFERLQEAVATGGLRNPSLLALIRASLDVKRGVIEEDEFESGLRQILNYGHTFGHALEAATAHAVPHGLAVAWGIRLVNDLAARRGWLAAADAQLVDRFVADHLIAELPCSVSAEALIEGVKRDKKAAAGAVTLAVLREPGRLERLSVPIDAALQREVEAFLAAGVHAGDRA